MDPMLKWVKCSFCKKEFPTYKTYQSSKDKICGAKCAFGIKSRDMIEKETAKLANKLKNKAEIY